jgi:hypothetical protein
MSMLSMKVTNTVQSPLAMDGRPASKAGGVVISEPDAAGSYQVVSLDQLKVVEGVYRRDQIQSPDQLMPGDAFRFPTPDHQFPASYRAEVGSTSIEVLTASKFGPSNFAATVTHSVIFLSETGKLLSGYVLDRSRNAGDRPSAILFGETHSVSDYILLEITQGCKDHGWPHTVGADPTEQSRLFMASPGTAASAA